MLSYYLFGSSDEPWCSRDDAATTINKRRRLSVMRPNRDSVVPRVFWIPISIIVIVLWEPTNLTVTSNSSGRLRPVAEAFQQPNHHRKLHQSHRRGCSLPWECTSRHIRALPDHQQENQGDNGRPPPLFLESTERLTRASDLFLNAQRTQHANPTTASRRGFFGSSLIAAGTAMAGGTAALTSDDVAFAATAVGESSIDDASASTTTTTTNTKSQLQWQVTPVNKRTGVTVFDAERNGYTVPFVTYLSRFLLTFDPECQRWWYNRSADIPRTADAEQVTELRRRQFAAFAASVEVGLQEYRPPQGPAKLMGSLLMRYCKEGQSTPQPLDSNALIRQERETREARRQICLLFALMNAPYQPVDYLTQQLAVLDNGSVARVQILQRGSGYAPGYGPPVVRFAPPDAGPGFVTATGRAVLTPNGRLLRVDVVNRGQGYSQPPTITVAPPAAIRFGPSDDDDGSVSTNARAAQAKAILFRTNSNNKGRIERIQLIDGGQGYSPREIIRIRVSPPDIPVQKGGVQATATAVLEYEVSDIQIVNNGTGYALDKPIKVYVEPPPITARINMNDPYVTTEWLKSAMPQQIQASSASGVVRSGSGGSTKKDSMAPVAYSQIMVSEVGRGAGGCTGRECYDEPVVAFAYSEASIASASSKARAGGLGRSKDSSDDSTQQDLLDSTPSSQPVRMISAVEGGDLPEPINFLSSGQTSSSSELLSLLPAGVGLEFNALQGRYELAVDPTYPFASTASALLRRKIDPDFGPRGRAPIERDMQLGVSSYLRFILSGAICCSGVHLALTPLDVVKTKVQSDPKKYPGMIRAFQKIYRDDGAVGFTRGWLPTFLGFFCWGGVSYALTEFLRRSMTEAVSVTDVASLEVPIILLASACGAVVGSFIICPFESVRIRSVSQKDFAPTIIQVAARMVTEEGVPSLFAAIPLFLLKEVPFAMAKFTVFDLSSAWLYEQFPTAKEDLQFSLLVSLLAGTLGGVAAAVVSNPADITITTVKKAKTEMGPGAAAALVIETGGPAALFTGLPIRSFFYSLLVSLQFLVYDSVRFALGIGSDDLKLYLDVLGGALGEGPS